MRIIWQSTLIKMKIRHRKLPPKKHERVIVVTEQFITVPVKVVPLIYLW